MRKYQAILLCAASFITASAPLASSADNLPYIYRYRQPIWVDAAAPLEVAPRISDLSQNRLYLGAIGMDTNFVPTVVDDKDGEVWNHPGTKFELSVDISKYGLTFDRATGTISGIPTMSFIERDVVMTVISPDGRSDSTAPFKIGVSEEFYVVPSDDMKRLYFMRNGNGKKLVTEDPDFKNTLGEVSYYLPSGLPAGYDFDAKTGILRSQEPPAEGDWNKTIFVRDEFGREGGLQLTMQIRAALEVDIDSDRTFYDTDFDYEPHSMPLVENASPDGVKYSAAGLPPGMQIDEDTGEIFGAIDKAVAWNTPFTITVTATDQSDGSTGKDSFTIRTAAREGYQFWRIADNKTNNNAKDVNGTMIWGCTNTSSFSDPQRGAVTTWKRDADPYLKTSYSFPEENLYGSSGLLGTTCSFAKDNSGYWWKSWKFKEPVNVSVVSVSYRWGTNVGSAIKNPIFQGSKDGINWVTLWTATWSPAAAQNVSTSSTRPN